MTGNGESMMEHTKAVFDHSKAIGDEEACKKAWGLRETCESQTWSWLRKNDKMVVAFMQADLALWAAEREAVVKAKWPDAQSWWANVDEYFIATTWADSPTLGSGTTRALAWHAAALAVEAEYLPCGHPQSALVGYREGDLGCTVYCGQCAKPEAVSGDMELPKRPERKLAYGRMMYAASDVRAYVDVAEATIRQLQEQLAGAGDVLGRICVLGTLVEGEKPVTNDEISKDVSVCAILAQIERAMRAESALAEAQEQIKKQEWVSVSARLPENDDRVEKVNMALPFPEVDVEVLGVNHEDIAQWKRGHIDFTHWRLVTLPDLPPQPESEGA